MTDMKRLIYPGSGWDNTFLNVFPEYHHYILIDAMPIIPHYHPEQYGYKFCSTAEVFFKTLENNFGKIIEHDKGQQKIYFPNNVEYWYNRNVNNIKNLPEGDILLNGFFPDIKKWKKFYERNDCIVYVGCLTCYCKHNTPKKSMFIHYHTCDEEKRMCNEH